LELIEIQAAKLTVNSQIGNIGPWKAPKRGVNHAVRGKEGFAFALLTLYEKSNKTEINGWLLTATVSHKINDPITYFKNKANKYLAKQITVSEWNTFMVG
jgi:hypothetical protein